jgi:1,4-alpha-glucan branching enzyme
MLIRTEPSPHAELLAPLQHDLRRIVELRHHDPHGVLGAHLHGDTLLVMAHLPRAKRVRVEGRYEMVRLNDSDLFAWAGARGDLPARHRLEWQDENEERREEHDPYAFPPQILRGDLERFAAGHHCDAWRFLGAHMLTVEGITGVRFAVWAPDAERVSVVGPFCRWDGRRYAMRALGTFGVWEIFIPGLAAAELYKFEIRNRATGAIFLKSDPYMRASEQRPASASIVTAPSNYSWGDDRWLAARATRSWLHAPMSIYEVHLGSWQQGAGGAFLDYREIANRLVPYVKRMGFTHIELLPVTEHPLDDSWGYQTTGYFAPTSRHGSPDDLRYLVDMCHRADIGVLLDWVPGHFPRDAHALANFDGTALYEYPDALRAEHRDWGTLVFNYERHEVRAFLLSSACYWLEEFHFDGLRVDAVASMLYLDFGRRGGESAANRYGGNQNLEAISFLRELNATTHTRFPGTVVIAEESTDWPLVSRPPGDGGLGFSMKWNMGWMHDTLAYVREDPVHRSYHHNRLTFGMMYAYTENFVLPLSHDEVVHLKGSLLGKMPGDAWQRFANLRLLFTYQWTLPGKTEWDFRTPLPWHLDQQPAHGGVQRLVADLNRLYASDPRLHRFEFDPRGFRWIDCDDRNNSVLTYLRQNGEDCLVVALNFTPVPRHGYRVGVPRPGRYREILNSDSEYYGGSNVGNIAFVDATAEPATGYPWSLSLTLPPLAGIVLAPDR